MIKLKIMKKKNISLFLLGIATVLGFSIPNVKASSSMPEVVTCYFAESSGGMGYYRCGSGTTCTWIEGKMANMAEVNRDCIKKPGQEVVGGEN